MIPCDMKAYAELRSFGRFVDIQMVGEDVSTGARRVLAPAQTVVVRDYEIADPGMSLTRTQAQQLIDALWACGIRPTEGAGSAGSLAATERHLKDMQTIAMGALKKAQVLE